jgi:hypothetical protein
VTGPCGVDQADDDVLGQGLAGDGEIVERSVLRAQITYESVVVAAVTGMRLCAHTARLQP